MLSNKREKNGKNDRMGKTYRGKENSLLLNLETILNPRIIDFDGKL